LVVALPGQNFELRRCFSPATPMMGYTAGLGWNLSVDSYVHKVDVIRDGEGNLGQTRAVAYIGVYAVPQRDTSVFHNDRTGGLNGTGKFFLPAGPGTTFIEEIDSFPIPTGVNGETTMMPVFRQVTFGGGATVYFRTTDMSQVSLPADKKEKYKRLDGMIAQQFDPFGNVWTYDYDEAQEWRRNPVTGLLEDEPCPRLRHVFLHGTYLGDTGMRARLDFDWDWGYMDEGTYIWRTDMLRRVDVVRFVTAGESVREECVTDSVVYAYVQDLLDIAPGGNAAAAALEYIGTPRCLAMATRRTLLNAPINGESLVADGEIHDRFSQYRYALDDNNNLIGLKAIFYPEQFEYIAENATTDLQTDNSLGEMAGEGNLATAAAYELLQRDDNSSADAIALAGAGEWTPKQLAGKWMHYGIDKTLAHQLVRSGCGCGTSIREDYGIAVAHPSKWNKIEFPTGVTVTLKNYARIVHERACDKYGTPVAGPPLRTRIYRNEQRIIHRVDEFPDRDGPADAPFGWTMMEWSPFTTAEAIFEYSKIGDQTPTVKKVWVTGYEYDVHNRTITKRLSSSMLSGVSTVPMPTLPVGGGEFEVSDANREADSLDFLVDPVLVKVDAIPGYWRSAYKTSTGGMTELTTYRELASEAAQLDSGVQQWFSKTFGKMASLDIVERRVRAGTQEFVTEQKEFLPFSSWRPDLPTVQRILTGVAASPKIESENQYQLEAFYGGDVNVFGPSAMGTTLARIATLTTETEGDGADENGSSNANGAANDLMTIRGFSTIGNLVWERQTSGRLDIVFHDDTTGAEVMRANHVGYSASVAGKTNIAVNGPHGRAFSFLAAAVVHDTEVDSLVTVSLVDIMGRERRRTVNIPNMWDTAGGGGLVLQPGGHVTDTKYGLEVNFIRWYPELAAARRMAYVETHSDGFFSSPTSTRFFDPPSVAQVVWLGPATRTYLDSAMNMVAEETKEANYILSDDVLSRTEYSLDLAGKIAATRKWWYAFSIAAGDRFFVSRVERDALGRVRRSIDENGGVTETDYDAKDRAIETRTGANESADPAGFAKVRMVYDHSSASTAKGGDGLLDFTIQSAGDGQPDRVRRTLYDNLYRPIAEVAVESVAALNTPVGPWKLTVTDRAGRLVESATASSELSVLDVHAALGDVSDALSTGLDGLEHLNSHEKTHYSANRGLAYRTESAIEPGDWSKGVLRTDRWFDTAGNVQTQRGPSSLMTLYWRDAHNRVRVEASTWPDLFATNLNTVLAPSKPAFQRTAYSYHRGTSLVSQAKTTFSSPDTSLPAVRSIVGYVYDPVGRSIATIDYGHGTLAVDLEVDPTISDASQPLNFAATAPPVIPMPLDVTFHDWYINSYDSPIEAVPAAFMDAHPGVRITRQSYNAWGLPQDFVDATGRVTRTLYDALGRAVGTIENVGQSRIGLGWYKVTPDWIAADGDTPGHWSITARSYPPLAPDDSRISTQVFDGLGNQVLRVAFQRNAPGETTPTKQFSRFVYNIAETEGSFSSAGFGSSNLLYEIRYPDPGTGLPSSADEHRIRYRYNQAGEQTAVIDQNGTTRLFTRDSQGRLLTDAVQLPLASGSAVDTTATAIRNAYDTSGRVSTTEMLGASNATLNKVTYEYDLLGGVKALKQIAGYAGGNALGGERIVRYDLKSYPWLNSASGVSGAYLNNWRGVMGVTYPDGTPGSATDDTELRYYPDADRVNELSSAATDAHHRFAIAQPKMLALRDSGAYSVVGATAVNPSGVKLLANVHRLGMGRTVSMSLDVPQVHLDRVRSMTGKTKEGVYGGWDRFGRLKQQVWALTPTPAPTAANATPATGAGSQGWMQDTSSTPTYPEVRPVYQHAYSYSEDSDRLSDDDLRPTYGDKPESEGGTAAPDRKYGYDNLRRLTKEEKGRFTWSNGSQSFASGMGSKSWSLDMLGNWKSVAEDADGNGVFDTAETSIRTHDAQNQLTSLGATTAISEPKYIREYDNNGNLIWEKIEGEEEPTRRFFYDAWNRLVRVERGEGGSVEPSPVATYTYNALNWRVTERVRWPGDPGAETSGYTRTRVFFFSSDWQVLNALEDRHAETPTTSAAISTFTPDSETQFFWGVRDKDELLQVRTRALADANGVVYNPVKLWTDNGFVNTVYALTDAQMSVGAYVSSSGRVRESRLYDSYGRMTRTLPGDLNGDGVCDDVDFGIFEASYNLLDCSSPNMPGAKSGYGSMGGTPPVFRTWGCPADLNGDWVVDEVDFGIFAASYNQLVPDVDALVGGNAAGGGIEWGPGWNGYWYDPATGLWLSRNRWYDPVGGRWITRDPAGYVDGLSLYLYVKGNPFLFRDPSGLEASCAVDPEWHHGAPKAVFQNKDGTPKFKGVDVNEKEYGRIMTESDHRGGKATGSPSNSKIHKDYNKHWDQWVKGEKQAGRPITKESVLAHLNDIETSGRKEFSQFKSWLGNSIKAEHSYGQWDKQNKAEWLSKKMSAAQSTIAETMKEVRGARSAEEAGAVLRRAGKAIKALGLVGMGAALLMEGHAVYAGEKSPAEAVHDTVNPFYTVEDGKQAAQFVNNTWDQAVYNGRSRVDQRRMDTGRNQPGGAPLPGE